MIYENHIFNFKIYAFYLKLVTKMMQKQLSLDRLLYHPDF